MRCKSLVTFKTKNSPIKLPIIKYKLPKDLVTFGTKSSEDNNIYELINTKCNQYT